MTLGRIALLLPITAQLLLWALASIHRQRLGFGRLSARGTLVMGFVAGQIAVVAITEVLSVGHHLTTGPVAAAWLLVTLAAAVAVVRSGGVADARRWWQGGGVGRTARAVTGRPAVPIGLLVLALVGATLVFTALWFLPNNSDSLAYHLTRVAHWVQNRSVEHFATHYPHQIQMAPLHEYNMLHLHLLAGTDRLDGFPQLASFVVSAVGASEVVRLLRGSAEVQVLAAVIFAVTPGLLLEATSTQNNLFPAAMAMAVVLLLLAWEPLHRPVLPGLVLGSGLALAAFGKGTAVPLIAPLAAMLGVRVLLVDAAAGSWSATIRRMAIVVGAAAVAAVVLMGPFQLRNREALGSLQGDVSFALNDEITPSAAAANSLRNLALQFRIGDGRSGINTETSQLVLPALRTAYGWTGEPLNSGHLDYGAGHDAFELRDYSEFERNEDYGASPWLTALLVPSIPLLVLRARRRDAAARLAALVAVGGVLGFVVFSVTTKWTPYGARYLLPLLALGPPVVALALAAVHRHVLRGVAVLLVVAGLPSLLDSWARPLLDRPAAENDLRPYYVPRPKGDLLPASPDSFARVRDSIARSGCTKVGVGNWILFEYLLWVGLDHVGWEGEIQHVGPFQNASGSLEDEDFEPCAVVWDTGWLTHRAPARAGMVNIVYGALTLALEESIADRAVSPAS